MKPRGAAAREVVFTGAAAAFVAFAVWGSLFPFEFHAVPAAEAARLFYVYEEPDMSKIPATAKPALKALHAKLAATPWNRKAIGAAVSEVVKASGLKMPELAMPARLLVTGRTQTPSLDAVLELIGRDAVLQRLARLNNA